VSAPAGLHAAQVHGAAWSRTCSMARHDDDCSATKTRVKDGLMPYAVVFEDEPFGEADIQEPEGGLRLHSYNPEFPDKRDPGDQLEGLQIAGEVMYRSGSGLAGGN
jgi:hypothetical protein